MNPTIKEIRPELFRLQVPLPGLPLGDLNAYIIRSPDRNLVIDTGLDHKISRAMFLKGLADLKIRPEDTDIFLTHFHADHIGLVKDIAMGDTRLYCLRSGWDFITQWQGLAPLFRYAEVHGFPSGVMETVLGDHPGNRFRCDWEVSPQFVTDGDMIRVGNYNLMCIPTPGHSVDHLCLYEPRMKILFSGDHLLGDITPNIQCWTPDGNPLGEYFKSLKRTCKLDIRRVLPGHRGFAMDHGRRTMELIAHHIARLEEIIKLLQDGPKTAFEIASAMNWHIQGGTWNRYPMEQQWFATVEVIAHLHFLEAKKEVKRMAGPEIVRYCLNRDTV